MPRAAAPALALGLFAGLAVSATVAGAHTYEPERQALATVRGGPDGLEVDVLLMLRYPRGPMLSRLKVLHDLDRSGQLEAKELMVAATALVARTRGDLEVRADDRVLEPVRVEPSAQMQRDGALLLVALAAYRAPLDTRVLELLRSGARGGKSGRGGLPVEAALSVLPPLAAAGIHPPVELKPGGRTLRLDVAR